MLFVLVLKKRNYLSELSQVNQAVEIKRIKLGNDIVLKDNVMISEVELDFDKIPRQFTITSNKDILFQKDIYERVNIAAIIKDISLPERRNGPKGVIDVRKALAIDNSGEISMSLFGEKGETIEANRTYKISDLT